MEGFSNPHENKWQMSPKRPPSQTLGALKGSNTNRFPRRPPKKILLENLWLAPFFHGFLDHVFIFGSWSMVKVHVFYPPKQKQETSSLVWFQRLPLTSQGATCYQHWRICSTTWGLKGNTSSKMWSFFNSKNNNNLFDWMFRNICQQTYLKYVISIFTPAFFWVGKSWKPIHRKTWDLWKSQFSRKLRLWPIIRLVARKSFGVFGVWRLVSTKNGKISGRWITHISTSGGTSFTFLQQVVWFELFRNWGKSLGC